MREPKNLSVSAEQFIEAFNKAQYFAFSWDDANNRPILYVRESEDEKWIRLAGPWFSEDDRDAAVDFLLKLDMAIDIRNLQGTLCGRQQLKRTSGLTSWR